MLISGIKYGFRTLITCLDEPDFTGWHAQEVIKFVDLFINENPYHFIVNGVFHFFNNPKAK